MLGFKWVDEKRGGGGDKVGFDVGYHTSSGYLVSLVDDFISPLVTVSIV